MADQQAQRTPHSFRGLTFNTDGRPHPLENTLVAVTFVLGVVSVASCAYHSVHVLASWTGVAGIVTGGVGQFLSKTTAERFVLVISLGMAALGFYIGMAHGGWW